MEHAHFQLLLLLTVSIILPNLAIPSQYNHFVSIPADAELDKNNVIDNSVTPEIYEMHISSDIRNRFAKTIVRSKVRNLGETAQETKFFVILPEAAFISGFIMEIDNTNYTAYVLKKEDAQKQYDEAKSSGLAAAYVGTSFRDANRFMVSVNIKPQAKAAFYLTYEELLYRKQGRYEHILNIYPGQPLQNLKIQVLIHESRKLTLVEARPLNSGKETSNDNFGLNPHAEIVHINDNTTAVQFSPNLESNENLDPVKNNGLAGRFVVQYDVQRDPTGGQVLLRDGYFVHFFAPSDLETIPKHVVFLLDTSSSMEGNRIKQLQQAMTVILDQMHSQDLFHLVEFNTNVKVWNLNDVSRNVWYPISNKDFDWNTYDEDEDEISIENFVFPSASVVNSNTIRRAKRCIGEFQPHGATDIQSAFKVALHLVNTTQRMKLDVTHQSIIIFLTDGVPNVRYSNSTQIRLQVRIMNRLLKASVFSLSIGDEADKYFTKWLALGNFGFARHIYDDLDASLQLTNFYETISSPLLRDVKFEYDKSVASLTLDTFPIYFDGSELMVAGFCGVASHNFTSYVTGYTNKGRSNLIPVIKRSISSVERIWAYLTIKQLLDKKDVSDEERKKFQEKATELALKYSFVTPLTSLVVLQPNASYSLDTAEANKVSGDQPSSYTLPDSVVSVNLEVNLPWLKNLLREDTTIDLLSGRYKIASPYNITEVVSCPKTPTDETPGNCKLLNDCPEVYAVLTDFDVFVNHSCILQNEYAGICCPKNT